MPIYKNPITIVQGEKPSENQSCLSYVDSSSSSTSIQTANNSWFYTQSSYGHGILRTNPTTNLSVELNNANTYRIIVKFKVDELQNRDMVLWYCSSERIGVGTSNYVFTDSSGYGFSLFDYTIEANKWYYAIIYKDNLTAANILTLSVYDDNGTLIICGAFAKKDMKPTINRPFLLGGQDGYQQLKATKTNIELNEFVMEKDGIAVWGATNAKTQNMGVFRFDDWNEFTEVDYIESTGTQWIDTLLKYKNGYKAEMEIEFTKSSAMYGKLIGAYLGNVGSLYYRLYFGGPYSNKWEVAFLNTFRDGGNGIGVCNTNTKYNVIFCTYSSNQYLSINGNTLLSASYSYNADNSPNPNATIPYMATGILGKSDSITPHPGVKTYSLKFTDYNGNVVRNYKPCYHTTTGIVGLFDTVNNKFYTNAGTGEFIKGADV